MKNTGRPRAGCNSSPAAIRFAGFALNSLAVVLLARHAAWAGTSSVASERRVHLYALELIAMLLVPTAVALVAFLQWRAGDLARRG